MYFLLELLLKFVAKTRNGFVLFLLEYISNFQGVIFICALPREDLKREIYFHMCLYLCFKGKKYT